MSPAIRPAPKCGPALLPIEEAIQMKRLSNAFLLTCGVLALNLAASAQAWGQAPYYTPRTDPYDRNRDGYTDDGYRRPYGYGQDQRYLISRVISDLNRAAE